MDQLSPWQRPRLLLLLALASIGCQDARGRAFLRFDPGEDGLQVGWVNLRLAGCHSDTGIEVYQDPAQAVDPRTTVLRPILITKPGSVLYSLEGRSPTSHDRMMDSQVSYRMILEVAGERASGFFSVNSSSIPEYHYRAQGQLGSGWITLALLDFESLAPSKATVSGIEVIVGNCQPRVESRDERLPLRGVSSDFSHAFSN